MEKHLNNWLQRQLINEETYNILLKEVKEDAEKKRKIGITITVYIMGIILIGLGIASFIAANDWLIDFLNRNEIIKIILLSGLTISSLYFGYKLAYEKENYIKLGKALICLSSILIGCTYMLTGQIYNINAHSSFLMMLWCVSIIPLAYIFKEKFINILATVLFIIGFNMYFAEIGVVDDIYFYFIPLITGALLYLLGGIRFMNEKYHNFAVFYKLFGLTILYILLLIQTCVNTICRLNIYFKIPLICLMIIFLANGIINKKRNNLYFVEGVYFFVLFLSHMLIMLPNEINSNIVIISAHIFLITMFYFAVKYGYKYENIKLISMFHWYIGIYLFVIFCKYGWSFFDKTIFFLLSGIILITMGILFERKREELKKELTNG